ncbi:MAG: imidazole glycerol phosphate synthase subunit HisH [Methanoregula sp.]
MKPVVGLLDYGRSGNQASVKNALEVSGASVNIICNGSDFDHIDKIVLPGVGNFRDAMEHIHPLQDVLVENIRSKPTLGICLGMQILCKLGFEGGETRGLGIIDAEVKKMEVKGKVPHLGWGNLEILKSSPLLDGLTTHDNFYFMHSYEVVNFTDVIALTNYCDHKYVSLIQKGSVFGVQFHPEKSRNSGIRLIKNFLSL